MSELIVQTSLIGVLVVVTAILAAMLFYKKELIHSHKIQVISVAMASMAVLISIYDKLISPVPPEAFAECVVSGEYAPVNVQCTNRSEGYSSITWVFENGDKVKNDEKIERILDIPGIYKIVLYATSRSIFGGEPSKFETEFQVIEKPLPARIIETKKSFEVQGKGGSFQRTFEADPGFKILSATVSTYSQKNAASVSVRHDENRATVSGVFIPKTHFKGLSFVTESGYVAGAVTLKQQEIRPKKPNKAN